MLILPSCGHGQTNDAHESRISENIDAPPTPEPNDYYISSQPTLINIEKYDFSDDAQLLINAIEDAHPSFIMYGWSLENYFMQREFFLSLATSNLISIDDFEWAIRRYITSLRDSHMNLFPLDDTFIDIETIFYEGNIYVSHGDGTQSEIITIGGVPIVQVLSNIEMYFYLENDIARFVGYPNFIRRKSLLLRSGAEILDNNVQIALRNGNNIVYENHSFVPLLSHRPSWDNDYVINYHMINDIFYIRASLFACGSSHFELVDGDDGIEHILTLCWLHNELHDSVADAVYNGIRYFIVDVRDNTGGNSIIPTILLEQMGIKSPYHGGYRRASALTRAAHPDVTHVDDAMALPSLERASNPQDIFLVVLMNNNTNSSANLFASWIQDGNLGYLIGEPSIQSPSMFGDMLTLSLPQSNIDIPISHLRINRADTNADQTTLWPDIIVPSNDALRIALEFIYNYIG